MKITIQGKDYTSALDASQPLSIERKLNEPVACRFWISLLDSDGRSIPSRSQSVLVVGDSGTEYFRGYIASVPMPEYVGVASEGPQYRYLIQALSIEYVYDQVLMPSSAGTSQTSIQGLFADISAQAGMPKFPIAGTALAEQVNVLVPTDGSTWSERIASGAAANRVSYRIVNGAFSAVDMGGVTHALSETTGNLNMANLALSANTVRHLANDITVCGEREPWAYVTEYFHGDGTTLVFPLTAEPFQLATSKNTLIQEGFAGSAINTQTWYGVDSGAYYSLGSKGLAMSGGNGIDGGSVLAWIDRIEMGGTLLMEATGVTFSAGCSGVLCGFFGAQNTQDACIAGFLATPQNGTNAVVAQPLVFGSAAGVAFTINPASEYVLRVRVHCKEMERVASVYRAEGDGGLVVAGRSGIAASGLVQMEIQEYNSGVAATPVSLYDGSIGSLPTSCSAVAASSLNLVGSMRAIYLTRLGSAWVVSTPATGSAYTRRLGTVAEAAECHVERTGNLVFYSGYAPALGEQVAVSYRTAGRAVGRSVNTQSQLALAAAGLPSTLSWVGSVKNPAARSSADCRNAANVLQQVAAGVSAAWSGVWKGTNFDVDDVWPGDALVLSAPSANINAQVIVRSVQLRYQASVPDLVAYMVRFANDWAEDLAIQATNSVPADAQLPVAASPVFAENLTSLTVTSLNGSMVTINTGVAAPTGGGFEVRRRDFAFAPGVDTDLVMRASTEVMSFSRVSENDRFYIRMYDGATPPNYSEFSTALFVNLPLGS